MTQPALVTDFPRPEPSTPRPYHFPRFTRTSLDNGLGVVVAPARKLPVVTLLLVSEAGAVRDPAGKAGVAQLAASLLREGTQHADGAELARRFERLGTSFDASADWDVAVARLTVTTSRLDEAARLFGEVVTQPSFPAREVERLRAERLAELLQQRAEPRGLAEDMFARCVYAEGTRFATPDGGDETTVASLTRDDVHAFWVEHYAPQTSTLVIVGDVDEREGARIAQLALGGWSAQSGRQETGDRRQETGERHQLLSPVSCLLSPDTPARLTRAVHLVDKPDAAQAELRLGHVGLPRLHPDYFPVTVMNALLGGLFNSRINLNLRERHGYTYGAFSGFDWRRDAGPFAVSTAVATDVAHLAAAEALGEIERFGDAEVTERELTLATDYLDGVFPIRFETTAAIAGALGGLVTYSLPTDYYDTYRAQVRAVTPDAVRQAARAHLHSAQLQLVVVGAASALHDPLEGLGFGPLMIYDASGRARE